MAMDDPNKWATGSGADPEIIKRVINAEQLSLFDPAEVETAFESLAEAAGREARERRQAE